MPDETAVTLPYSSTFAISGFSEYQVTDLFEAFWGATPAEIVCCSPINSDSEDELNFMFDTATLFLFVYEDTLQLTFWLLLHSAISSCLYSLPDTTLPEYSLFLLIFIFSKQVVFDVFSSTFKSQTLYDIVPSSVAVILML